MPKFATETTDLPQGQGMGMGIAIVEDHGAICAACATRAREPGRRARRRHRASRNSGRSLNTGMRDTPHHRGRGVLLP